MPYDDDRPECACGCGTSIPDGADTHRTADGDVLAEHCAQCAADDRLSAIGARLGASIIRHDVKVPTLPGGAA